MRLKLNNVAEFTRTLENEIIPPAAKAERLPMLAKIMKWISISLLVLAVLCPSPAGYQGLLTALAVCAGALLAAQTRRAGKYFGRPDKRGFHAR
jgi:hypothetical protein